jgi:hypothetical protein
MTVVQLTNGAELDLTHLFSGCSRGLAGTKANRGAVVVTSACVGQIRAS